MKKLLFSFTLLASFSLFFACSSDDNSSRVEDVIEDEYEYHPLFGNWFPTTINASALTLGDFEENYPHQENCEADYLRITETETIFNYHDEDCNLEYYSSPYEFNNDVLNFNFMGYDISLSIVKQTPSELILAGSGADLAPLIPVLLPEYADMIPESLLHLVEIKLSLVREINL